MTTTLPRTSQTLTARSRRTRTALVAAVRSNLRAHGTFTADSVADLAGCSPATFYSHFGTKDDALTAAFDQTLTELVDGSVQRLTVAAFDDAGIDATVAAFVEWQAQFFRVESLVFRAALSRLPAHQPLRAAYRRAEEQTLTHMDATLSTLQTAGTVRTGDTTELAEAFMIASQGINNPRALRSGAAGQRAALAAGISGMLKPRGISQ